MYPIAGLGRSSPHLQWFRCWPYFLDTEISGPMRPPFFRFFKQLCLILKAACRARTRTLSLLHW